MPPIYKVVITALVVVGGIAAHLLRDHIALEAPALAVFVLVAIMVIGLWSFPEPAKKDIGR